MMIKILHIWGPTFKHNFGGQFVFWQSAYESWSNEKICHLILDYDDFEIYESKSFNYSKKSALNNDMNMVGRFIWGFKILFTLIKKRKSYDILHVHTMRWGGGLVAPLSKLIKKHTIYESVLEGADNPTYIINQKFGRLLFWCQRQFTSIICISSALSLDFQKHNILSETIPNWVDIDTFTPVDNFQEKKHLRKIYNIAENAKVLLFVGSVKYRKGIDLLINAYLELRKTYPNLYLLIVGPKNKKENSTIDEEYVSGCVKLLQKNDESNNFYFTGLITKKKKLSEYYKLSDIFVFPSRQEGLGNVLLEACAAQLPIIVSNLNEFSDIIIQNFNGIYFPNGNLGELEAALLLALSPKNLKKVDTIAKNARQYVEMNFTFIDWQNKISELYQNINNESLLQMSTIHKNSEIQ